VSEHISNQDSERYRKRTMESDELFATSFHLAICDACHSRFGSDILEPTYSFVRDELRAAEEEEFDHISVDQMAAYLDQSLSWPDREVVETHFEICSQCNAVAEKQRLLDAPGSSTEAPALAAPSSPTWTDRWRQPAWRIPIQLAAAVLTAVLLVWLVTLPLRTHVAGLQAQVEQLQQTNQALNLEASTLARLESQLEQYRVESERLRKENEAYQAAINRFERGLVEKHGRPPLVHRSPSQPVIAITDASGPVVLDEQGNITGIDSLPLSYQLLIKAALTSGQVRTPPLIGKLRGKTSKSMSNAGSPVPFALVAPSCTVIESDSPIFRWQPLAEATGYSVTLLDSTRKRVVTSPALQTNEWQIPSRLKRGGIYYWQVKALKDGREVVSPSGSAADVGFRILNQTEVDQLERAKREFANSHLALGVIYAHMGLLNEAEREIEALARVNPSSDLVQRLLRSLRIMKC
jgi:hypothetical protein